VTSKNGLISPGQGQWCNLCVDWWLDGQLQRLCNREIYSLVSLMTLYGYSFCCQIILYGLYLVNNILHVGLALISVVPFIRSVNFSEMLTHLYCKSNLRTILHENYNHITSCKCTLNRLSRTALCYWKRLRMMVESPFAHMVLSVLPLSNIMILFQLKIAPVVYLHALCRTYSNVVFRCSIGSCTKVISTFGNFMFD
jgi:hypothetical protein